MEKGFLFLLFILTLLIISAVVIFNSFFNWPFIKSFVFLMTVITISTIASSFLMYIASKIDQQ